MPSVRNVRVTDEVSSGVEFPTALLGSPLLLRGESLEEYVQLLDKVMGAVQPQDVIEEIFVGETVDLVWAIRRGRRLEAGLIAATQQRALTDVLRQLMSGPRASKASEVSRTYISGNKDSIKEVNGLLDSAGLTWDAILAEAMAARIDEIERLNRQVTQAEGRLRATLRELERHRTTFGKQLRAALAIESKAEPSPTLEVQNTEERLNGNNAQD